MLNTKEVAEIGKVKYIIKTKYKACHITPVLICDYLILTPIPIFILLI